MTKFIDLINEHLNNLGLLELARSYPTEIRIPYSAILEIEKNHEARLNSERGII